jgi:hypothetical protein
VLAEEREARTAARASDWAFFWSGVGVGVGEVEGWEVVVEKAVVEEGVAEGDVDDGAVDVVAGSEDILLVIMQR